MVLILHIMKTIHIALLRLLCINLLKFFSKVISDNIICNAIAPGPFPSKMLGSAVEHDYSIISKKNPSNRVGKPQDIAGYSNFF